MDMLRVGTLAEIQEKGFLVVHAAQRPIVVFAHDGVVSAIDNRCPHMGFPLHRGTVKDHIVTCHWHEARFDLCGGCTFDTWADDVPVFDTEVRDGVVFVATTPRQREDSAYHLARLTKGMVEDVGLVQAKSIVGLLKGGADWREIVRTVALLAATRRDTFSPGMVALTAVARLMPTLGEETAYFALCYATRMIATELQGAPPRRKRQPLLGDHERPLLERWMRHWVKSRHRDGAEFVLLTAIEAGATPAQLGHLVCSAETDRVYSAQGHTLDGVNKAFELVDVIGEAHAPALLPMATPAVAMSRGAEEDAHWHHPVEIIAPLREVESRLESILASQRTARWSGGTRLIETLLGDDPLRILAELEAALRAGAAPAELSRHVAYAAALRLARFAPSNDVRDWFNPQHTFIYANAVHQAIKRSPTPAVARGLLHAAMAVYMDRFLNVPPAKLPNDSTALADLPSQPADLRARLLSTLDQRSDPAAAPLLVARWLRLGHPLEALIDTLAMATIREDLDFHTLQVLEAGVQQCREWTDAAMKEHILIGVVRQLAAQCPTRRAGLQTATIALRLHRKEKLYE